MEPSCSILTDGQAEMMKMIVVFRNLTNGPKKIKYNADTWIKSSVLTQVSAATGRLAHTMRAIRKTAR